MPGKNKPNKTNIPNDALVVLGHPIEERRKALGILRLVYSTDRAEPYLAQTELRCRYVAAGSVSSSGSP